MKQSLPINNFKSFAFSGKMMPVKKMGNINNIQPLKSRIERKFYIPPHKTELALGLLRHICRSDKEYSYGQINSLDFDTPDLDQYERSESGDYAKDKVRLRWYGIVDELPDTIAVFIELKSRRGMVTSKQRVQIDIAKDKLLSVYSSESIIAGDLLQKTLADFGYFLSQPLAPVIFIHYRRYRFNELMSNQRISLDLNIRSTIINGCFGMKNKNIELPGGVIEIKGETVELPYLLRQMKLLETDWTRFSKYSACLDSHMELPGTTGYISPSGRVLDYP